MKLRSILFAAGLALALPMSATALDVGVAFSPRTGDVYLDTQLGDINVYARTNSGPFIDDVVVSFGAPRHLVQELYTTRHWAPGDIYYACALAHQLGRPCLEIVDIYERDRGQGWGVIAQRLGIKPGSAAFHALKGKVGKGHGALRGGQGRGGASAAPGGRPGPAAQGGKPGGTDRGQGGRGGDDRGGKGKGKDKGRG